MMISKSLTNNLIRRTPQTTTASSSRLARSSSLIITRNLTLINNRTDQPSSSSSQLSKPFRRLTQPQRNNHSIRLISASQNLGRSSKDEGDGERLDLDSIERVSDEVDVCIVGGGPSGLSAAIRLRQLALESDNPDLRVVVLEKGSEIGSHILSGAVIETRALDELLPNWKQEGAPLNQIVTSDSMKFLTQSSAFPLPHPPQMKNAGKNYIVSLSKLTRWLGDQAEKLGVEIYPGFAGAKLIYNETGDGLEGVVTNDIGLDREGRPKESVFEPGMEFRSKLTLLAEGCHGSLTKMAVKKFELRKGKDPQTYGLGIKEVWRVRDEVYEPGKVVHTLGWPLSKDTYGGSWLYHLEDNMVSLGLVVGLDYPNPYLSPYQEFQRMKHHPFFKRILEGGECVAYGARALNEGGYQSIPKLTFPGGALIGCTAGFLNVPKIKGTHTAMKSGMIAAEAAFEALSTPQAQQQQQQEGSSEEKVEGKEKGSIELLEYSKRLDESWVIQELKQVRNLRPSFHTRFGLYGGILYSGIDSLILRGRVPWTFHHPKEDHLSTKTIKESKPINYPNPDNKISFDILTSVSRTGTNHAENQPNHLVIRKDRMKDHLSQNVKDYDGLLNKACPAGVYEYVEVDDESEKKDGDGGGVGKRLVINSQNCIHCKTCSIKVPTQDITWTVPEGGGGPAYSLT